MPRQRHHWLVRTRSTVTPAARIAAPISRACSLPRMSRLRWVVQSSSVNCAESPVPGAWAWRTMATMPGWDRRANRASAAAGAGGRRRAAIRAMAGSRRVMSRRAQSAFFRKRAFRLPPPPRSWRCRTSASSSSSSVRPTPFSWRSERYAPTRFRSGADRIRYLLLGIGFDSLAFQMHGYNQALRIRQANGRLVPAVNGRSDEPWPRAFAPPRRGFIGRTPPGCASG